MTDQSAAAAAFKQWQIHQTVEALKQNSAAVRSVCDIRQYVDSLDAGLALCRESNGSPCIRCHEAGRIAEAIRALLPETSERRADSGEGGDGVDGTRVTRGGEDDRELGFGGDDVEAAFGGSETGGGN